MPSLIVSWCKFLNSKIGNAIFTVGRPQKLSIQPKLYDRNRFDTKALTSIFYPSRRLNIYPKQEQKVLYFFPLLSGMYQWEITSVHFKFQSVELNCFQFVKCITFISFQATVLLIIAQKQLLFHMAIVNWWMFIPAWMTTTNWPAT